MRAGAAGIEKAAQEIVDLGRVRGQRLDLHAVRVPDLRGREAGPGSAGDPSSSEIARVPRPQLVPGFGGDGYMVEIGRLRHQPASSRAAIIWLNSSRCSSTIRPVEK